MRLPIKSLLTVALLSIAVLLVSWDYISNSDKGISVNESIYAENYYADVNLTASFLNDVDNADVPFNKNQVPTAEDVLIKKIPGDNSHLLMMAYFSKENFSDPSFTIENGSTIVFKDDGTGFDAVAGDGLYTARITADVKEFKRQAINLMHQMKAPGYKPIRYINRVQVYNPDEGAGFDEKKFDANEAVSITSITNGLADFSPNTTNSIATAGPSTTTIGKNSIFITDLKVVEDSTRTWNFCTQTGNINGPWTFGTVMRQLASPSPSAIATDAQVSAFVKNWLNHWTSMQVVNGDTVAARALMNTQILTPWLNKSKSAGSPTGQLDMHFAPFKLTAIVNRFDLRDGQKFAASGDFCGQGRFVFCLIKSDCTAPLGMTINVEYSINKPNTCADKLAWAQQWFNLANMTLGSSAYNQALQAITDQFSLCGTNPNKPNQSSLSRLRTNEITLSNLPKQWEQREFLLDSTGQVAETTVGQTPADKYNVKLINNDVQRMAAFVNQNASIIIAGQYVVPATWQSFPFLGGSTHVTGLPTGQPPNVFHWDGTDSSNKKTHITSNSARFTFSFQTCSGCHSGEMQTGFTHVDPVMFGTQATLSGFLSGKAGNFKAIDFDGDSTNGLMSIKDAAFRPSSNPTIRTFNDIDRRAKDLKAVVNTTCGSPLGISSQLLFKPLNMTH